MATNDDMPDVIIVMSAVNAKHFERNTKVNLKQKRAILRFIIIDDACNASISMQCNAIAIPCNAMYMCVSVMSYEYMLWNIYLSISKYLVFHNCVKLLFVIHLELCRW